MQADKNHFGARQDQNTLRRWLHRLRFTPLHPQFLAFRYERKRYRITGSLCSGRVLDIGSGRQPLREYLAADCEYFSLDHPGTGAWYGAKPAVFGDACLLPFANQTFDTVVCLEVLEHLPQPREALAEARRVLKPGGRLIISTPFLYPIHDAPADYQRWTRHGLELLVDSVGFEVGEIRNLGGPIECGVLMFNLGLAWRATTSSALGSPIYFALSLILLPLGNLLALLISQGRNTDDHSPFAIGYLGTFQIGRAPAEIGKANKIRASSSPVEGPVDTKPQAIERTK